VTFTIKAEKVPNAAGIKRVMEMLGGPTATWDDFVKSATPALKGLKGGWIVGGYLSPWIPKEAPPQFKRGFKVVQDILPSSITDSADILLPSASWAEKAGCWENYAGKIQAFDAAVAPPNDSIREGDVYYKLLGKSGFYNADDVRAEMGEPFASVKLPTEHAPEPAFEFVEL
jgi:NADH-quinone oxidoreductase subunit G